MRTRDWPKHIVVGTDFSDCSLAALRLAAQMADKESATLSVVHILPLPDEFSPLSAAVFLPEPGEELTRVENQLVLFIRRAIGRRPMPRYRILRAHASDGILFVARFEDARLIVLGTRGIGNRSDLTLGSIAEQVLNRSNVPVLTLCSRRFTRRRPETIRHILCPVNLSSAAARALEIAVQIGKDFGGEVTALEIVERRGGETAVKKEEARLRAWLKARLSRATRVSPLVITGDAADEILRYAKDAETDLIVIGARRERFAHTTVFGTTTTRVTRHAPCAVLTVTSS
jgi:nucleotide-binding universal stress UspA family protein